MTEKRYFYRDPLEAAYMAKHYGVEFYSEEFSKSMKKATIRNMLIASRILHIPPSIEQHYSKINKFYIHPDSLQLLDVIEGDIVVPRYGWRPKEAQPWDVEQIKSGERPSFKRGYRIICRHRSKPFFWPEEESASDNPSLRSSTKEGA